MANLKAIRKRIQGVSGTQQLTRAMKLVAAAKLRRAQENAINQRMYAQSLAEVISHIAPRLEEQDHPLLAARPVEKTLLILVTSDRGLCGAFNLNICRAAQRFIEAELEAGNDVTTNVIGKKGYEFLMRRQLPLGHYYDGLFASVSYDPIARIGNALSKDYVEGQFDRLVVIFNRFRSAALQTVTEQQILPVALPQGEAEAEETLIEHIFEPDKRSLLDVVFPMYVNIQLYQALLESVASEMGARMTAMDNATNNAADLIKRLTLKYNKARQEAITTELMDIVGGAEALS